MFFFSSRRRHTRFDCDWSSDVCSSDLTPGSEVLVPLYHAGQLVGLWSVRHSNPGMYHDADADMLALLAPQLALMLAIEGSVQPVVGASARTKIGRASCRERV